MASTRKGLASSRAARRLLACGQLSLGRKIYLLGNPLLREPRAHQVPIAKVRGNPEHLRQLEEWLRSYRPEELFDDNGAPVPELLELSPRGEPRADLAQDLLGQVLGQLGNDAGLRDGGDRNWLGGMALEDERRVPVEAVTGSTPGSHDVEVGVRDLERDRRRTGETV